MMFKAKCNAEEEMPLRKAEEDEDEEFESEYKRFSKFMERYEKHKARKAPSPTEQKLGELGSSEPLGQVPSSGIGKGPRVPHTPSMSAADTSSGRMTAEKVDTQFQSNTIQGMHPTEWGAVKEVMEFAAGKGWLPLARPVPGIQYR